MKKKILYSLLAVIIFISLFAVYTITNPVSPLETVSLKNTNISITYSRPYKNDRLIFGEEIDGALVGGASLNPREFAMIAQSC